jgi:hypothetical protein
MAMTKKVKATRKEAIVVIDNYFCLPAATSSGQVAKDVATLREAEWVLKQ